MPRSDRTLRLNVRAGGVFATLAVIAGLMVIGGISEGTVTKGGNGWIAVQTGSGITAINPFLGTRQILAGSTSSDFMPEVSPDGNKVAFVASTAPGTSHIFLADFPSGNNRTQVTTAGGPYGFRANAAGGFNFCGVGWNPGSNGVTFCGPAGLYVSAAAANARVDFLTGSTSTDQFPDYSPDGSFIVFDTTTAPSPGIGRLNANQSGGRLVLAGTVSGDVHPRVSPNLDRVFFHAFNGTASPIIGVVGWPNGGSRAALSGTANGDYHPFVSPDGTKVAFTTGFPGSAGIAVLNADGTGARQSINGTAAGDALGSWSKFGAAAVTPTPSPGQNVNGLVVVESIGTDNVTAGAGPLTAIDPVGGGRTPLAGSVGTDDQPEVSSDGTRVTFVNNGNVFVADFPSGNNRTQITTAGGPFSRPNWSRDSSTLIYSSPTGLRTSAPTSNALQSAVPGSVPNDSDASFSTDTQFIFFNNPATTSDGGLSRVNANGSGSRTRLLDSVSSDTHPRYLFTRNLLVFDAVVGTGCPAGAAGSVCLGTTNYPSGGARALLTGTFAGDQKPSVSPDGLRVIFTAAGGTFCPGGVAGSLCIGILNSDGTGSRAVLVGSRAGDINASWGRSAGQPTPTPATPTPGPKCPGHEGDSRPQTVGTGGDDVLIGQGGGIVCGLAGNDIVKAANFGSGNLVEGGDGIDVLCARQSLPGDVVDGGPGIDRARFDDGETAINVERFAPATFCAS